MRNCQDDIQFCKTSIHAYTFISEWTTSLGYQASESAAKMGYNYLVIPLRFPQKIFPSEISLMMEEFNLEPIVTSNSPFSDDVSSIDKDVWNRGMARHRNAFNLARDMGARKVSGILYGAFGKANTRASSENLKRSAEAISILAEEAGKKGLSLSIEIVNRYESNLLNTVQQALEYFSSLNSDKVLLHLDTFHMNIEESNLLGAIKDSLPFLTYFEMNQNNRGSFDQGLIDFNPMFNLLKQEKFSGIIGVEGFSSAISAPLVAGGVCAWRPLFERGEEVAYSAMEIIKKHFSSKISR